MKLLTIEQVSELLKIKISRIRTAVFKKEVEYIKLGRLVRFSEEQIYSWIEKNKRNNKGDQGEI